MHKKRKTYLLVPWLTSHVAKIIIEKEMMRLLTQSNFLFSFFCLIYLSHSKSSVNLKYISMKQTEERPVKTVMLGCCQFVHLKILISVKNIAVWKFTQILTLGSCLWWLLSVTKCDLWILSRHSHLIRTLRYVRRTGPCYDTELNSVILWDRAPWHLWQCWISGDSTLLQESS